MSVVTATILSDGQPMDPAYELLSIDVSKEVNRIPHAQIVLLDGDAAQQKFAISNTAFFEPGKSVEIKLRYEGVPQDEATVFKGVVVAHGVEAGNQGSMLTVELKDAAVKLALTRRSEVFRDQTDDKIIGNIITRHGLQKGKIAATHPKHAELVQYYCTDWDFMLARADAGGLLVNVENGTISLQEISVAGPPRTTFEYGISEIYNFEIEADAGHQYPEVQSLGWDQKNQKLTSGARAKSFKLAQGNLDGAKIAKAVGFKPLVLTTLIPLARPELQAWSDATLARSRMAMIRGRIAVVGTGAIKPLDVIKIAGIGERFNGKALVTGVRHRVDKNGWQTDLQLGLSAAAFVERRDIVDVPAAGLLPAVNGLQIGIVAGFEEDPAKELRVKVILPGIDPNQGTVWARLATPDAGNGRGYFFRPEPGDEVVVGFFNDDPRQAVILGAMYGSKNAPARPVSTLAKENVNKAIISKKGTAIRFVDDKKASLLIETPSANKIVLNDDAQTIEITDQHGNSIKMGKDGIEIKSAKDLKISASGNVEIKGAKVDVK